MKLDTAIHKFNPKTDKFIYIDYYTRRRKKNEHSILVYENQIEYNDFNDIDIYDVDMNILEEIYYKYITDKEDSTLHARDLCYTKRRLYCNLKDKSVEEFLNSDSYNTNFFNEINECVKHIPLKILKSHCWKIERKHKLNKINIFMNIFYTLNIGIIYYLLYFIYKTKTAL